MHSSYETVTIPMGAPQAAALAARGRAPPLIETRFYFLVFSKLSEQTSSSCPINEHILKILIFVQLKLSLVIMLI
jgi:hypothetical protein